MEISDVDDATKYLVTNFIEEVLNVYEALSGWFEPFEKIGCDETLFKNHFLEKYLNLKHQYFNANSMEIVYRCNKLQTILRSLPMNLSDPRSEKLRKLQDSWIFGDYTLTTKICNMREQFFKKVTQTRYSFDSGNLSDLYKDFCTFVKKWNSELVEIKALVDTLETIELHAMGRK